MKWQGAIGSEAIAFLEAAADSLYLPGDAVVLRFIPPGHHLSDGRLLTRDLPQAGRNLQLQQQQQQEEEKKLGLQLESGRHRHTAVSRSLTLECILAHTLESFVKS